MADLTKIEAAIDTLRDARFAADWTQLSGAVESALTQFGYADAGQKAALYAQLVAGADVTTAAAALTWATASREAAIVGQYQNALAAETPIPAETP